MSAFVAASADDQRAISPITRPQPTQTLPSSWQTPTQGEAGSAAGSGLVSDMTCCDGAGLQ